MNEQPTLDGKIAVITGATRGIGFMVAKQLLQAGCTVYVGSRSAEAGERAVTELSGFGSCHALVGELHTAADCHRLGDLVAQRESQIHILINNAAVYGADEIETLQEELWDEVFAVNVKAPFMLTRTFVPMLTVGATLEDPSRIINIGSISGLLVDGLPSYPYSASKAALHHLTRMLAQRLGPLITVNAIAAGPFESDTMLAAQERFGNRGAALPAPMRRLGQPVEIGGTVIYLSSPAGAYTTGAVLPVDGGISTTR
jgi:NAD(P)-dependent dehydrogenase (short-subunit alcohol dehydrogenase family)